MIAERTMITLAVVVVVGWILGLLALLAFIEFSDGRWEYDWR